MPAKVASKQSVVPLESTLSTLAGRVSDQAPHLDGSIVLRVIDTGEEFSVDRTGKRAKVTKSIGKAQPVVQVSGTSSVIRAVLDGEMEASRAFASGGLRVKGDLRYLEGVLKDLGLLQCE